jgi:hypothetical protein
MSEIHHGDKTTKDPDPSPHSGSAWLRDSLDPIQQFKIAKTATESSGYLGNHPQDMLLPMVLTDYVAIRAVNQAGKIGGDLLNIGKDQLDVVKEGLGQVRDLGKVGLDVLTLDFDDAGKDATNLGKHVIDMWKAEWNTGKDALKLGVDIVSPVVTGVVNAGKDVLGAGWDIVKDEYHVLKDDVHMVGDTLGTVRDAGKTALDVMTLDFPDAYEDAKKVGGHVSDFGKHAVAAFKHGTIDPVKHAVSGVVNAIADLF